MNLGSGVEVPIHELARRIAPVTGYTGGMPWDPGYPEGATRGVLNVARAHKESGFGAPRGPAEGWVEKVGSYRATLDRRIVQPQATARAQSV